MYTLSGRSKNRMVGVHPFLVLTAEFAIDISPIDFGIPAYGGLRLDSQQLKLFNDGVSPKCDGIEIKSKHQKQEDGYAHALDFYAYLNGSPSWRPAHLSLVYSSFHAAFKVLQCQGSIPDNVGLIWGGTFGSDKFDGWDKPHVELVFY